MTKRKYGTYTVNGVTYYRTSITTDELTTKGTKKRIWFTAPSVWELDQKVDEYKKLSNLGLTKNKNSFASVFGGWLFNIHICEKKPSTVERYKGLFKNHINIDFLNNIDINSITLDYINQYQKILLDSGRSVNTIKQINKLLKPFIRYANVEGLILRDFSTSIKAPKDHKANSDKITYFTIDEQKKFLSSIKDNRLYCLYAFDFATGLRMGELLALTWNDIDIDRGVANINKSLREDLNPLTNKYEFMILTPKNGKSRNVSLPTKLLDIIKQHKAIQDDEKEKARQLYEDKNLIFATEFGNYIGPGNLRKSYARLLKSANVEFKKFHSIRHTYATRLFEKDIDIKIISELMGHSNVNITWNTYIHVIESVKGRIDIVDVLNDFF